MDSLENFTAEIEEELEHVEWLLLTLDYAIFVVLYVGAVFTFLLFLTFIYNFAKKVSNLYGAYFYILAIGYFIDFCSVIFYTLNTFVFEHVEVIVQINNAVQWYAKLFVGFWNTLLVLNRLTALLWWNRHTKIWEGKFFAGIVLALFAYPFIVNGYAFGNFHCILNIYDEECTAFLINMRYFMAASNGINAIIALVLSLITAFARRCYLSDGKATQKFERRLLIQALISSIIFGSYCALTVAYSLLYPVSNLNISYALAFDITLDLGNLFYMLFHYSSAVLLIIVSLYFFVYTIVMNNLERYSEETEEHLESIQWLLDVVDISIDVICYSGVIFTFFLTICLLYNFSKNLFNGAYYYILVLGYTVDFCSVIMFIIDAYVFTESATVTKINNAVQWYAKLFVGFWNTLLVLNRLTALLWWNRHTKIWEGKFFAGIVLALFAYPFIVNGYSFGNPCQLEIQEDECTDFMEQSQYFIAIVNGINAIFSLMIGLVTAFAARISSTKSSQKYEKQLLIQSIISSFLFGSYCALTAAYSILYSHQNNLSLAVLFDFTRDFSNLFYMLFHYSSAVLLIIVSKSVRKSFMEFYKLFVIFKCCRKNGHRNSSFHNTRVTFAKPITMTPVSAY